ncbi:MAG: copper resistance protein CopC [Xanthobacteraceae bacterium]|nr:MAG: copper resistance protein CopC [Xanthobacteraceae bacterium]
MRRGTVLFACAMLLAGLVPSWAHSVLRRSSPADGAVLAQPPAEIRLTFNEAIETRFSVVEVSGPGGKVAAGALRADKQNEIAVGLPALPPGRYDVRWRVISVDSHKVQGRLFFEVRP